jgi:hypothetical protein
MVFSRDIDEFGEVYGTYQETTRKLLPFIY